MTHAFGSEYLEYLDTVSFFGGDASPQGLIYQACYRARPIPFQGLVTDLEPADLYLL